MDSGRQTPDQRTAEHHPQQGCHFIPPAALARQTHPAFTWLSAEWLGGWKASIGV